MAITSPGIPETLPDSTERIAKTFLRIPQSDAPPSMVEAFGENPWEVQEREAVAADIEWRRNALSKLDQAALDPDAYFKGADLSFSRDPKQAQRLATVEGFLQFQNGGEPVGGGKLNRDLFRLQVAQQLFDGRGADSDEEFHGEIVRAAQLRKDRKTLGNKLAENARQSALLNEVEPTRAGEISWEKFRDEARKSPGYSSDDEYDLYSTWNEVRNEARERISSFAPEISRVWQAMQQGGAGTASEVGKAIFSDLTNPDVPILETETLAELKKQDAAATAFEIYRQLAPEDRADFMDSLGFLARTFPKEEQATFFGNLAKQGGRDLDDQARNIGESFIRNTLTNTAAMPVSVVPFGGAGSGRNQLMTADQAERAARGYMAARNFASDVRRIERSEFSPMKSAWGDAAVGSIESGLYAVPGALTSTGVAAIPGVGTSLTYLSMEGAAYDSMRQQLMRAGMSDEEATQRADAWAPLVALPQTVLEKLQASAILGKLPVTEKVMTGLGNKIASNALRGTIRATAGALEETAIEVTQDYIPYAVQDVANALGEDVPGVVWRNGKDGALDGFWAQSGSTLVTMLPLAILGAVGGVSQDQRIKAFAGSSDRTLLALGASQERIDELRAAQAQGFASTTVAVNRLVGDLSPYSDSAKQAVAEIEAETQQEKEVAQSAQGLGILPQIIRDTEGWTVRDPVTGGELLKTPSIAAASQAAVDWAGWNQDLSGNEIALLTTQLEAIDATAQADKKTGAATVTEFSPSERVFASSLAAESPQAAERIMAETETLERLHGGDGSLAQIIRGSSRTEFEQGQRRTLNKLNAGSDILTVFHEEAHGFRVAAMNAGRLTRDEQVAALRYIDQGKRGRGANFLPEGVADAEITEEQLDEGVSNFMEAYVFQKRKSGAGRDLDPTLISRGIRAAAKASVAARKFKSFADAIRSYWGIVVSRAISIRKGIREGTLDAAKIDDFVTKLTGLSEQDSYDASVTREAGDMIGSGESLSLGPATLADALAEIAAKSVTDPKKKERIFRNMAERLEQVRKDVRSINNPVAPLKSSELFSGAQHEAALLELDARRQSEDDRHQDALEAIAEEEKTAIENARADILAKLGPDENRSGNPEAKRAFREARDQAVSAVKSEFAKRREAEKRGHNQEVAKLDRAEQRLSKRGAVSDERARGDERVNQTRERLGEKIAEKDRQRQAVLNSLSSLDALLAALPPDLRGRVGGYTQLAKLTTDKARQDYLTKKLQQAEAVVDKWLSKQYGQLLDKLMERAKAKGKAGEKPKGKAGADVHALFDVLRQARGWSADKAEDHAMALEAAIDRGELTEDQEAHNRLEAHLVRLVGDWKNATLERRMSAVEEASRIFDAGYASYKLRKLMQKEEREIRRAELGKDIDAAGDLSERQERLIQDNGIKGKLKNLALSLGSFDQLLEFVFGKNSAEAVRIADMERNASNQKEDEVQSAMEGLDNLFSNLAEGSLAGEQLRYRMAQPSIAVTEPLKGKKIRLSEAQGITATLMWRQEDGRRHMIGPKGDDAKPSGPWHYDQAFVDAIEAKLSPEAKAVRDFLADRYAGEYATLNPVYRELNGVNLPKNANYSPLTVKPNKPKGGEAIDPITGTTMTGASTTPGSLKSRGGAVAEPDFRDALQTYIAHTKQMAHWKAYAPFTAEAGALLRNRDMLNAVESKGGEEAKSVLGKWLDFFAAGGNRDAAANIALNKTVNKMSGRAASAVLVGRMSVLAVQSVQLGASLAEMPTGSFIYRFARLWTPKGLGMWRGAFQSEYIQRRMAQMPPVVQAAVEGLKSSKPNLLTFHIRKLGSLISGADALFTAGTYAMVRDYQLQQAKDLGLTGADAEAWADQAAARSTDRVAQPTRAGARSLYENTTTNAAGRILWMFASESRQKLALSLWRGVSKERTLGEKARAVAVTWVIGGMLTSVIRAAYRDMRDDEDDEDDEIFDERNWDPKRMALAALTGPFQGIPFLGDVIEGGAFALAGEYLPNDNVLDSLPKAFKAATRIDDWGDMKADEILRDIDTILTGAAVTNDSISAASSLSHLVRDVFGVADNFTD